MNACALNFSRVIDSSNLALAFKFSGENIPAAVAPNSSAASVEPAKIKATCAFFFPKIACAIAVFSVAFSRSPSEAPTSFIISPVSFNWPSESRTDTPKRANASAVVFDPSRALLIESAIFANAGDNFLESPPAESSAAPSATNSGAEAPANSDAFSISSR